MIEDIRKDLDRLRLSPSEGPSEVETSREIEPLPLSTKGSIITELTPNFTVHQQMLKHYQKSNKSFNNVSAG
jgi:hypothetical protein